MIHYNLNNIHKNENITSKENIMIIEERIKLS